MNRKAVLVLATACLLPLAGCDMLGIESAQSVATRKEAEGKAIGSACRHSARALEDCFALNKKADKSAVFAGWREMNDYMRENKIDAVAPQVKLAPPKAKASAPAGEADGHAEAKGAGDGHGDKADKADKAADGQGEEKHAKTAPH